MKPYREDELIHLQGNDVHRKLEEWDHIYNYAYYNDLANPDKGITRPVLGGSNEYPYPRSGKTGRAPSINDPNTESRLNDIVGLHIYVPRDERFGHLKMSNFLGYSLKSLALSTIPKLRAKFDDTAEVFDSMEDVMKLFKGGPALPKTHFLDCIQENNPLEFIKALFIRKDSEQFLKFPLTDILRDNNNAWRTYEEFAREMLAGVNPVTICKLKEFPPTSTLDSSKYGNQISSITEEHLEVNLEGLTVEQALNTNKLYILDHHDGLMPYLNRINSTENKVYATRTLVFLKEDSTLKPIAIELSLPHPKGEQNGAINKVFTPPATDIATIKSAMEKLNLPDEFEDTM